MSIITQLFKLIYTLYEGKIMSYSWLSKNPNLFRAFTGWGINKRWRKSYYSVKKHD